MQERRECLGGKTDQRDPLEQIDYFPEQCGVSLAELMIYELDVLNAVLADVPVGQTYWEFTRPEIHNEHAETKAAIMAKRDKMRMSYSRWTKNSAVLGDLYDQLIEAEFSVNLRTKA